MKKKDLILVVLLCGITLSLFSDPTNPEARRGKIRVISSEFGGIEMLKKYPVSNAIDENPATAWVLEEKETSFKVVNGLLFEFKTDFEIDGISIINGYTKGDSLYYQNTRIQKFEIILPNNKTYEFSCIETTNFQDFKFPKQKTKWMVLKITKVVKGTKFNNICISELSPTINSERIIYNQSNIIISNNGKEYESDLIFNIRSKKQLNLDLLDFGCGAQFPIQVNDSILIYSDECNDSSHIEIICLGNMTHKAIRNHQLDKLVLVDAISDSELIMMDSNSNNFYQYSIKSKSLAPINYTLKNQLDFWHWSERLTGDFSEYYRKLE